MATNQRKTARIAFLIVASFVAIVAAYLSVRVIYSHDEADIPFVIAMFPGELVANIAFGKSAVDNAAAAFVAAPVNSVLYFIVISVLYKGWNAIRPHQKDTP